jgi:mannose-6-phosphate isomerase-like protein (cupin superfamily)
MEKKQPLVEKILFDTRYQRLIPGAPATAGIKSGAVVLQPGESVGEHVTEHKEECIVVLHGRARLSCAGAEDTPVDAPAVLYVPPETAHNIVNDGSNELRYVYVTAPVIETKS